MNGFRLSPVCTADEIARTAALAAGIWREHYTPLIGAVQVEYMLERFQSPGAISRQIREGCLYYLARGEDGAAAGYFAVVPRGEELFLSKLYLVKAVRGRGYSRLMLERIEELARGRGCSRITLTVNRRNSGSIAVYGKLGFVRAGAVVQDIGNGFVMDDYAMRKDL